MFIVNMFQQNMFHLSMKAGKKSQKMRDTLKQ